MAKKRPHFWRITFQRFRREADGSVTALTDADLLEFDDKMLDQGAKEGWDLIPIRPGALGLCEALISRMKEFRKSCKPYRKVKVTLGGDA